METKRERQKSVTVIKQHLYYNTRTSEVRRVVWKLSIMWFVKNYKYNCTQNGLNSL